MKFQNAEYGIFVHEDIFKMLVEVRLWNVPRKGLQSWWRAWDTIPMRSS